MANHTSLVLFLRRPGLGDAYVPLAPATFELQDPLLPGQPLEANFARTDETCERELQFSIQGTVTIERASEGSLSGTYDVIVAPFINTSEDGTRLTGAFSTTAPPCEINSYARIERCEEAAPP